MKNPTFCRLGKIQRYIPDLFPHIGVKTDMCLYVKYTNCL